MRSSVCRNRLFNPTGLKLRFSASLARGSLEGEEYQNDEAEALMLRRGEGPTAEPNSDDGDFGENVSLEDVKDILHHIPSHLYPSDRYRPSKAEDLRILPGRPGKIQIEGRMNQSHW